MILVRITGNASELQFFWQIWPSPQVVLLFNFWVPFNVWYLQIFMGAGDEKVKHLGGINGMVYHCPGGTCISSWIKKKRRRRKRNEMCVCVFFFSSPSSGSGCKGILIIKGYVFIKTLKNRLKDRSKIGHLAKSIFFCFCFCTCGEISVRPRVH